MIGELVGRTAMIRLAGGWFRMGSDDFYPEERPSRWVEVGAFEIDRHPVTNSGFAAFVSATGYVTEAERAPDGRHGSLVFVEPSPGTLPSRVLECWHFIEGADWRHPAGPGSDLDGLDEHPVVHVSRKDAMAYARWRGAALPTEAEWEFAARGPLVGADYAWGDELAPEGLILANYWIGDFPFARSPRDFHPRTSRVGAFPPNGFGLHDMIGNVWEWTADRWSLPSRPALRSCCAAEVEGEKLWVLKGGSHLCASNHCQRYRPAARHPQAGNTSTSHTGFRCVRRTDAPAPR